MIAAIFLTLFSFGYTILAKQYKKKPVSMKARHQRIQNAKKKKLQPPKQKRVLGHAVLSKNAYDDCRLLSPDGILMAKICIKRFNWYIKKNLAEQIDANTIKLKFQPKGLGCSDDSFYLVSMENKCVACGDESHFTKHHVIPSEYRKHFPVEMKSYSSHDVVLLCSFCHETYETEANRFRLQLCTKYKVPQHVINRERDDAIAKVKRAAAPLRRGTSLPPERHTAMRRIVNEYLNKPEDHVPTKDELDMIQSLPLFKQNSEADVVSHGQLVVETIVGGKLHSEEYYTNYHRLEEFARDWRQHFIDIMKPKFLTPHWSVSRKLLRNEDRHVLEARAKKASTATSQ